MDLWHHSVNISATTCQNNMIEYLSDLYASPLSKGSSIKKTNRNLLRYNTFFDHNSWKQFSNVHLKEVRYTPLVLSVAPLCLQNCINPTRHAFYQFLALLL